MNVQVVVSEMLNAWGPTGFDRHICSMQSEYAQRAAVIQAAVEEHLTGLADWTRPAAGMFLWLKLLTVSDADEILDKLVDAGVVVVPGTRCSLNPSCSDPQVQGTYSIRHDSMAVHEAVLQQRMGKRGPTSCEWCQL